jgi:cell division inhibitor SulA
LTDEAHVASKAPAPDSSTALQRQLFAELFTFLASLLRSYTAVHGLHANREATVEQTEDKITVIHNEKWLRLTRNHAILTWMRENGTMGTLELTESGTLRGDNSDEAMDLAAEQWARDLMLSTP